MAGRMDDDDDESEFLERLAENLGDGAPRLMISLKIYNGSYP